MSPPRPLHPVLMRGRNSTLRLCPWVLGASPWPKVPAIRESALSRTILLLFSNSITVSWGNCESRQRQTQETTEKEGTFRCQDFSRLDGVSRRIVAYRKSRRVYSQVSQLRMSSTFKRAEYGCLSRMRSAKRQSSRWLPQATFSARGAWQDRVFVWGQRPRSHPRPCSLSKNER
jgi:hypothetical protein